VESAGVPTEVDTSSCRAGHAQFCGSVQVQPDQNPYAPVCCTASPPTPTCQTHLVLDASGRTGPVNPSSTTTPTHLDHPIRRVARLVVVAQLQCYCSWSAPRGRPGKQTGAQQRHGRRCMVILRTRDPGWQPAERAICFPAREEVPRSHARPGGFKNKRS
jgi:hypothetical protein